MTFKDWLFDHGLTLLALLLVTGTGLIAARWPSVQAIYPTMLGGILGLVGAHKLNGTLSDYLNSKDTTDTTQK